MKRHTSGYMLVVTLMIIGLAMLIVTGVVNRSGIHVTIMHVELNQEKARLLALSGLELARSRLANPLTSEDKKQESTPPQQVASTGKSSDADQKQAAANLIGMIMPQMNSWQTFAITETQKTEYGTIKICIGCEEGKINLNQLYDFTKHEFLKTTDPKNSPKALVEQLCTALDREMGTKKLFEKIEAFLKERTYPLNDITELCAIKEIASIFGRNLFLEPHDTKTSDKQQDSKQVRLYLSDVFTTWSKDKMLQPWLLSSSLKRMLGFRPFGKEQENALKTSLEKMSLQTNWTQQWNQLLAPIYGKDFSALSPALTPLLSTKFEPMVFSVVSYGSIKNVTQKLYAIVERKQAPTSDGPAYEIIVRRLYWL